MRLKQNKCYRCSHEWISSDKSQIPKVCPKCKSPYWDRPRLKPKKEIKRDKKKNHRILGAEQK